MSFSANLRTLLHRLLATTALSALLYATTKPLGSSLRESSEEQSFRGQVVVLASTTIGALFALRAGDILDSGEEVVEHEVLRRGMYCLEVGIGLNGVIFWGAMLFLAPPVSKPSPPLLFICSTMAVLFLATLLLQIVLPNPTRRIENLKLPGVKEEGKSSSSLPLFDLDQTRTIVSVVVVEEEPKETVADILSLSLLVGWSFLCLVISLAMTFVYRMDSSASLFIIPSALTLPCMFFPRYPHRSQLILVTSVVLILQFYARASYCFAHVSKIQPVCAIFTLENLSLGITSSPKPIECELARMLNIISLLTSGSLVARLTALHLTPMKEPATARVSEKQEEGMEETK